MKNLPLDAILKNMHPQDRLHFVNHIKRAIKRSFMEN